jgi:hypothetical protein
MSKFEEFLREEGVLATFLEHLAPRSLEQHEKDEEPRHYLDAFLWAFTIQGYEFWDVLNLKWIESL